MDNVAPQSGVMISVRDLRVKYGEREILHGVDFDVTHGETVVILGGSGSGKSTLLRTLVGLERPSSGHIWIKGSDIATTPETNWMKSGRGLECLSKVGLCSAR